MLTCIHIDTQIDMGMSDMWYIWLWKEKLLVIVKHWAPSEIDFDLWCVCHVLGDPRWLEGWTHCQVCISLCLCLVRRNWDTQLFSQILFWHSSCWLALFNELLFAMSIHIGSDTVNILNSSPTGFSGQFWTLLSQNRVGYTTFSMHLHWIHMYTETSSSFNPNSLDVTSFFCMLKWNITFVGWGLPTQPTPIQLIQLRKGISIISMTSPSWACHRRHAKAPNESQLFPSYEFVVNRRLP